jgi:small subunit ribosomal protein S9
MANPIKVSKDHYYATGRRKSSTARVYMMIGSGRFVVNDRDLTDYIPQVISRMLIEAPFVTTNTSGKFDVVVNVSGGGQSGQAGAIRHGLSRALVSFNEEFRSLLKAEGMLTRDSRKVERKKYGLKKARRAKQFSKR